MLVRIAAVQSIARAARVSDRTGEDAGRAVAHLLPFAVRAAATGDAEPAGDTEVADGDAGPRRHDRRRHRRARARLAQSEQLVTNRPADGHRRRLPRPRLLRPRRGTAPATSRTSATSCSPHYAGQFGWVFLGDILAPAVNSRGEVADLGDAPGVDRFDSINSRGAPGFIVNEVNLTPALGADADRARHRQHQLHAAHGEQLQPRRRLRRGHRAAGVAADGIAAHVDLRRQDRFGAGHRVPRSQGRQALRHHAVAHRALHDRHGAGAQGAHQVRRRRLAGARRRAHQRLVHHRDVPLLRRDRQQRAARPPAGGSRSGCRCSISRSAFRAATGRRIARPTPRTRCGSWAAT